MKTDKAEPEQIVAMPQLVPRESRRHPWVIALAFLVVAVVAIGVGWWTHGSTRSVGAGKHATFVQITDQPGEELYPSLSPDGKSVVYASRTTGNWDIYAQRIGGHNPVNLTSDSTADDTQPAFSPDGQQIVFRSERDGGGIFVMGASGENVRRVTDFGFDPTWSPDGREVVFALTIADPSQRLSARSQLFSVTVATGAKRSLTPANGNALQPQWSPHGYRIAYWGQDEGRRDIWTIPASGGAPVRVTNDDPVDWTRSGRRTELGCISRVIVEAV